MPTETSCESMKKAINALEGGSALRWDNQKRKDELLQIATQPIDRNNSLPLHAKNKIWLYSQYIMRKLSCDLIKVGL